MRGLSDSASPYFIPFEAFGLRMEARASSKEILARIEPLLPPPSQRAQETPDSAGFSIVEEGEGRHSVWNPNNMVCMHVTLDLALLTIEGQMRSWIAVNAPGYIFIHAGVVGHEGNALVIPGESFAGKTTLVAELVKRGASYFSDEFAVVDRDGLVHPYPQPLALRSLDGRTEVATPVEDLGGVSAETPLPMSLAAVTHYVPGAEWQPRRLSPGEGALALLSRTVPARTRPHESMKVIARAIEDAVVLEGERGEADEFATLLLDGALV